MDWSNVLNNFEYSAEDTVFLRLYTLFSEPSTSIAIFFVMCTLAYGAINSIFFFEENQQELDESKNLNLFQNNSSICLI